MVTVRWSLCQCLPVIDSSKIRAGQLATIVLTGEHKMNKGGRMGVPLNPLLGRVTRNHRITVTVAGPETYGNVLEDRTGEAPAGKAPWFEWIKDGLVAHRQTGMLYLAAVPTSAKRVTKYLVDGQEASAAQLATIREYTPEKEAPQFLCFALENVDNLAD